MPFPILFNRQREFVALQTRQVCHPAIRRESDRPDRHPGDRDVSEITVTSEQVHDPDVRAGLRFAGHRARR
jgi:hypothetical protein